MDPKFTLEVTSQRAEHIADLFSRYGDIAFVESCLARLVDLLKANTSDAAAVRAYWNAALTAYVRAFGTGKLRTKYGFGVLTALIQGHEQMHESIVWRRNTEAAHAVESAFDEALVGATFLSHDDKRTLDGIGLRNMRVFSPPRKDVEIIFRHVHASTHAFDHAK